MDWQQHLKDRAERYGYLALASLDPRQRVRARIMATEYETALTMCNTTEADAPCTFAPDHWLRQGCRRARTGSCAIVSPAVDAAHDLTPQEPRT